MERILAVVALGGDFGQIEAAHVIAAHVFPIELVAWGIRSVRDRLVVEAQAAFGIAFGPGNLLAQQTRRCQRINDGPPVVRLAGSAGQKGPTPGTAYGTRQGSFHRAPLLPRALEREWIARVQAVVACKEVQLAVVTRFGSGGEHFQPPRPGAENSAEYGFWLTRTSRMAEAVTPSRPVSIPSTTSR